MIRPDILNELGLSPGWKLRVPSDAGADAVPDSIAEKTGADDASVSPAIPVSEMGWDSLKAAVLGCEKCGLCKRRKQAVFGAGDMDADLFLAGEGPGRDEDRIGEPFVGRAGKLLDLMLAAVGLARGRGVYIANVVKCRPPENRNPTAGESGACMPYLDRQIALARPRLLVALGRIAAGRLLDSDQPVARLRQRLHDRAGLPLIVTYHPAYLLRNPADKRKAWEDLCFIRRVLKGGEAR